MTQSIFRTVGQHLVNARAASSVLRVSCVSSLLGATASLTVDQWHLIAKVAPTAKRSQQISPSHTKLKLLAQLLLKVDVSASSNASPLPLNVKAVTIVVRCLRQRSILLTKRLASIQFTHLLSLQNFLLYG